MENHVDFLGGYIDAGVSCDIRVKGKEWPAVGFKNIADAA